MANPAITRIFGYAIDELVGAPTSKLYARAEDWEAIGQIDSSSFPCAPLEPASSAADARAGEIFPGQTIKAPYRNGDGRPLGSIAIIRDVSWELETRRGATGSTATRRTGAVDRRYRPRICPIIS